MARRSLTGQSLTEYMFPIALIAVASIAALTIAAGNFKSVLGFMNNQIAPRSASIAIAHPPSGANGASGGGPSAGTPASSQTPSLDEAIAASGITSNLQQAIESTGANGATEILASQITEIADQLLAANQITPEQANVLKELANQGHTLAGAQEALEQTLLAGSLSGGWVDYNGKRYTTADFISGQLGFNTGNNGSTPIVNADTLKTAQSGPIMGALLQSFQKALATLGDNPAIQKKLTNLVVQMASIHAAQTISASEVTMNSTTFGTNKSGGGLIGKVLQFALSFVPEDKKNMLNSRTVEVLKAMGATDDSPSSSNTTTVANNNTSSPSSSSNTQTGTKSNSGNSSSSSSSGSSSTSVKTHGLSVEICYTDNRNKDSGNKCD